MRIRIAGLVSTKRTPLAVMLAFGLATTAASTSNAGLPCEIYVCSLDKKCSVGGSEPQDSCTAFAGEEVTYSYHVGVMGGRSIAVWDDKLGWIGSTSDVITKTTTLTETTTNWATTSEYTSDGCYCLGGVGEDTVTVTVLTSTPTPTATPAATPTWTPTATPTATPTSTPTSMPTATPTQNLCHELWPATLIVTAGKGQSPTNNEKITHLVAGNIIDPGSLNSSAHRIEVCSGTLVTATVADTTGTPSNTAGGSLACNSAGCTGVVNVTEKYQSISADGRDKDSITFIPK